MVNRTFQTLLLIAVSPFLWLLGVTTFTLVSVGQTWQAVRKIWA
jgi:hypothetical protein